MISLSQEWAILSKSMYGQRFIQEFAEFLRNQNVNSILECGCGDGDILHGLALRGFRGIGVDIDKEMIEMAKRQNSHPLIRYELMNWQDIDKIDKKFDAVICRGNSLSAVSGWGDNLQINPQDARNSIKRSIEAFFRKMKDNGLLYLDTVSEEEINLGGGERQLNFPESEIYLHGKISHDWGKRIRKITGGGLVFGEPFEATTYSYLMEPKELEKMIRELNPSRIWRPSIKTEVNYEVICARK